MSPRRKRAILTIELEDARRREIELGSGQPAPANPREVERQLGLVLDALEVCDARATFFTEGRLTAELPSSRWTEITRRHRIGCIGHAPRPVSQMLPAAFADDIKVAKRELEDATGDAVVSYRAPAFSAEGCGDWFGEQLAEAGFLLDSSRRLLEPPSAFAGWMPLPGSQERVREVPLLTVGFGSRRITIIGRAAFRLLPLASIRLLIEHAEETGFLPMVYLQPADFDPTSPPLELGERSALLSRAGDLLRRFGRETVREKLQALTYRYAFHPLESLLDVAPSAP